MKERQRQLADNFILSKVETHGSRTQLIESANKYIQKGFDSERYLTE